MGDDVTARREAFRGSEGTISVSVWEGHDPRRVVVIAHGYGEHIMRYEHVAVALARRGASVWGPDHLGHGRSDGERVVIADMEHVVDDLHQVVTMARAARPGLPVVLLGHSMGGLVAARFAQRHGDELAGLVLSGPLIGRMEMIEMLLGLPEVPDIPIDTAVLSRDPAVQAAYAADPLVWHGPFKHATLAAFHAGAAAVDGGPVCHDLPALYLHGEADQLVPPAPARAAAERLCGPRLEVRVYPGARHEILNETNRDEVIDDVARFVERVTAR